MTLATWKGMFWHLDWSWHLPCDLLSKYWLSEEENKKSVKMRRKKKKLSVQTHPTECSNCVFKLRWYRKYTERGYLKIKITFFNVLKCSLTWSAWPVVWAQERGQTTPTLTRSLVNSTWPRPREAKRGGHTVARAASPELRLQGPSDKLPRMAFSHLESSHNSAAYEQNKTLLAKMLWR